MIATHIPADVRAGAGTRSPSGVRASGSAYRHLADHQRIRPRPRTWLRPVPRGAKLLRPADRDTVSSNG